MLRRRKGTHILYWRLKRPRGRVYAVAIIKIVLYRIIAGALAVAGFELLILAGAAAGNIGYPRWAAFKHMNPRMVHAATVQALGEIGHVAPVALALGLPFVIIPRLPGLQAGITTWGAIAAGYFGRTIPPFHAPALSHDISSRFASLAVKIAQVAPVTTLHRALVPFVVALIAGSILHGFSSGLVKTTTTLIPHRPASHHYTTFNAVSEPRRFAATILTAGLLTIDLWIAQNFRARLPAVTEVGSYYWNHQLSLSLWIAMIVVVAIIICAPRPQGYQVILTLIVPAVAVYAFWPHRIFPSPSGIPVAPFSFWILAVIYFVVTSIMFDGVTLLLDW